VLAVGGLLADFYLSVAVAQMATGHLPMRPAVSTLVNAAGKLRHHLGDPRAGFPAAVRATLPPAAVFYGLAVLVTAAVVYAVVMVTRLWRRIGTGPASKRR